MRTSDIKGAGTDANVSIVISGSRDGVAVDSGSHKLSDSANNFERGKSDTFLVRCRDLGELKRVTVTSDGAGLGSSWHLDHVEVVDTTRSVSAVFPCCRWLDGRADPMSLTQVLLPRGADGAAPELLQYEVVVYTSDVRGAGTDANVAIELHGDKEHTAPFKLESSANDFERNRRDVFKVPAPDVGALTSVVIRTDGSGPGSDWHLAMVEVLHPGASLSFAR